MHNKFGTSSLKEYLASVYYETGYYSTINKKNRSVYICTHSLTQSINQSNSYTRIQYHYRFHVHHINVTIAKITFRIKINRKVEKVKSVTNIILENSQYHIFRKTIHKSFIKAIVRIMTILWKNIQLIYHTC